MRVWIDITNSPHVLFFRPLLRLLEEDGHEVEVTARAYAQTLELLELHGIAHDVVGPPHGGAGTLGKARAMVGRLPALRRFAKRQRFDLALAHGSHEAMLVARSLGIPGATAHDYEFATLQHQLGLRAARASSSPTRSRPERLAALRRSSRRSSCSTRAWRRSTTSRTSSPTGACSKGSTRRGCSPSCERPRTSRSTTGTGTPLRPACSTGSAATRPCTRSCCRGRTSSAWRSAVSASRRCTFRSTPSTRRALSPSPTSSSRPGAR